MRNDLDAGEAHDQTRVPLLLHSLAEFHDLIVRAMEIAGAKTVVEIGAEEGILTERLLDWATRQGGKVYAIDPEPSPRLTALVGRHPECELVTELSLKALATMPMADCYLSDGDHNYYTVIRELRSLAGRGAEERDFPLVFLHDVAWPCGRRDLYYAPETIPEDARHPFRYDLGAVRGRRELVPGGFRGDGEFAFAFEEGGDANGVLSAVEDFLRDNSHLEFYRVPCVFGLGVLFPSTAPYADALRSHFGPYHENSLLERLEDNRMGLYLRVLELQDEASENDARVVGLQSVVDGARRELEEARRELEQARRELEEARLQIRDVVVENRALLSRYIDLEDALQASQATSDGLRATLQEVMASRSMQVVDVLSRRAGRVMRRQVGLTRSGVRSTFEEPSH